LERLLLLLLYWRRCCVELALERLLMVVDAWLLHFLSRVRNGRILCLLGLKRLLLLLLYWRWRRCCVYVTLERLLVVDQVVWLLHFLKRNLLIRELRVIRKGHLNPMSSFLQGLM
jgi:hypothetical protein